MIRVLRCPAWEYMGSGSRGVVKLFWEEAELVNCTSFRVVRVWWWGFGSGVDLFELRRLVSGWRIEVFGSMRL